MSNFAFEEKRACNNGANWHCFKYTSFRATVMGFMRCISSEQLWQCRHKLEKLENNGAGGQRGLCPLCRVSAAALDNDARCKRPIHGNRMQKEARRDLGGRRGWLKLSTGGAPNTAGVPRHLNPGTGLCTLDAVSRRDNNDAKCSEAARKTDVWKNT